MSGCRRTCLLSSRRASAASCCARGWLLTDSMTWPTTWLWRMPWVEQRACGGLFDGRDYRPNIGDPPSDTRAYPDLDQFGTISTLDSSYVETHPSRGAFGPSHPRNRAELKISLPSCTTRSDHPASPATKFGADRSPGKSTTASTTQTGHDAKRRRLLRPVTEQPHSNG
jgi:hypothetical protein